MRFRFGGGMRFGGGRRMGPISRIRNAISCMVFGVIMVIIGVIILPSDVTVGAVVIGFGLLFMVPGLIILFLTMKIIRLARGGGNRDNHEVYHDNDMTGSVGGQVGGQGWQERQVFCQNCGQSRPSNQQFCDGCGGQ